MAEADNYGRQPAFPPENIPTIYSDGVSNLAWISGSVVKCYLGRLDPDVNGSNINQPATIAQVVMPMQGFVLTALFFQARLKEMVDSKVVPQEMLDQAQALMKAAAGGAQ